jgi:hypothetical protein
MSGTEVHPELINGRFAYVSVSRASHNAQIFTNDAADLAGSLGRHVSKTSAIDLGKGGIPARSLLAEQSPITKSATITGLGLAL